MPHLFTFFKGSQNSEVFSVDISDPISGDRTLNPDDYSKVELIVGDVVITSPTEITWSNNIITITPSIANLNLLTRKGFSELAVYNGTSKLVVSTGYVVIGNT